MISCAIIPATPGWNRRGAGRLLKAPTVWEDLVKTLLTTNTTWAMTRQMVGRLVTLGAAHADGHAFPTPEQVAALTPDALNDHVRAGYRGAYLHDLAVAIVEGRVDVEGWYNSDLPNRTDLYKADSEAQGLWRLRGGQCAAAAGPSRHAGH